MEKNRTTPEPLELWKRYIFSEIKDRARVREAKASECSVNLTETHDDCVQLISMVERLLKQVEAKQ